MGLVTAAIDSKDEQGARDAYSIDGTDGIVTECHNLIFHVLIKIVFSCHAACSCCNTELYIRIANKAMLQHITECCGLCILSINSFFRIRVYK